MLVEECIESQRDRLAESQKSGKSGHFAVVCQEKFKGFTDSVECLRGCAKCAIDFCTMFAEIDTADM